MQLAHLPSVSVVIPAKNAESCIEKCIRAVRDNSYPSDKVQVIVVDNGSTDATCEISSGLADSLISLPEVGISALRNRGAAEADGEILVFLDSDCIPAPGWLHAGVATVLDYQGVAGATYELPDNPSWVERVWYGQRSETVSEVNYVPAGNLFIPASLFKEIHGFNESIVTGEDSELCTRVKQISTVVANPDIKVVHLGNAKTLYQLLKREIWYGLGGVYLYRNGRVNKPFIATMIFISGTVLQLTGAVTFLFWKQGGMLFSSGTILIVLLLMATLFMRRKYISNATTAFQMALLYYIYYAGRALSLLFLLFNKNFYHNIKK